MRRDEELDLGLCVTEEVYGLGDRTRPAKGQSFVNSNIRLCDADVKLHVFPGKRAAGAHEFDGNSGKVTIRVKNADDEQTGQQEHEGEYEAVLIIHRTEQQEKQEQAEGEPFPGWKDEDIAPIQPDGACGWNSAIEPLSEKLAPPVPDGLCLCH